MNKNTIFYHYEMKKENDNLAQVIIDINDIKHFRDEFEQNEFIKFCNDWEIELNKKKTYRIKELKFYTTKANMQKTDFLSFKISRIASNEIGVLYDCLLISKEVYDSLKKYKLPNIFKFPAKIVSDFDSSIWEDYYFIKFFGVNLHHINYPKSAFYNQNNEQLLKIKNIEDYFNSGNFLADKKIICLSVKPKFDIINLDDTETYFSEEIFNELLSKNFITESEKGNNLIYFEHNKDYSAKLELSPIRYFDNTIDKTFFDSSNFEELEVEEPDINLILKEGYESEGTKIVFGEKLKKTKNKIFQFKEGKLECYTGINGNLEMYINKKLVYIRVFETNTYNVTVEGFDYQVFDDKFLDFLKNKYKFEVINGNVSSGYYFPELCLILIYPTIEDEERGVIIFDEKHKEYIENKTIKGEII